MRKTLVLSFLTSALLTSVWAADEWIELTSEHFHAVSNAGARKSRAFLQELEQFDHTISALFGLKPTAGMPLIVVIFKNERSFASYRPLRENLATDVRGYYQRGPKRDMIAVNIGSTSDQSRLILHEYLHRLTKDHRKAWPNWLNEGIAEFYSTFRVSGNKATIGAAIESHVTFLKGRRLMPIETLSAVAPGSPEYNEEDRRGLFFAQSWVLVHYLMTADQGRYRPQIAKFVRLLEEEANWRESFARAFEFSLADLETQLKNYVRLDRYIAQEFLLTDEFQNPDPRVRSLGEAESKVLLGDLLVQIGRFQEAEKLYQEAVAAGDETGQAEQRLVQLLRNARDQLDISPSQAQKLPAGAPVPEYLVQYESARAKFDEVGNELAYEHAALVRETFQEVEEVIQLNPDFAPAHHLFAELALIVEERLDEAVQRAEMAIRLDPTEDLYRVTLAQLHMFSDRYAAAREAIEPVTQSKNEVRSQYARQMLENIEKLESYQEQSGRSPQNLDSQGLALQSSQAVTDCRPSFVDLAGLSFKDGILRKLECGEDSTVFWLEVDGQEIRFVDPVPEQPIVFSCSLPLTELRCGAFDRPARIFFDTNQDLTTDLIRARAVLIKR